MFQKENEWEILPYSLCFAKLMTGIVLRSGLQETKQMETI